MSLETTLEAIHTALAESLLSKLNEGSITATEARVALELLKHNGINVDAMKNPTLRDLATELPNVADLGAWRD